MTFKDINDIQIGDLVEFEVRVDPTDDYNEDTYTAIAPIFSVHNGYSVKDVVVRYKGDYHIVRPSYRSNAENLFKIPKK